MATDFQLLEKELFKLRKSVALRIVRKRNYEVPVTAASRLSEFMSTADMIEQVKSISKKRVSSGKEKKLKQSTRRSTFVTIIEFLVLTGLIAGSLYYWRYPIFDVLVRLLTKIT